MVYCSIQINLIDFVIIVDGEASTLFTSPLRVASSTRAKDNEECKRLSRKWHPDTFTPIKVEYTLGGVPLPSSYGTLDRICPYLNGQAMHFSVTDTWQFDGRLQEFEDLEMEGSASASNTLWPRRVYCVHVSTTTTGLWHRECVVSISMVSWLLRLATDFVYLLRNLLMLMFFPN